MMTYLGAGVTAGGVMGGGLEDDDGVGGKGGDGVVEADEVESTVRGRCVGHGRD